MNIIRNKVLKDAELYENEPMVLKYLGLSNSCIKCRHDMLEGAERDKCPNGILSANVLQKNMETKEADPGRNDQRAAQPPGGRKHSSDRAVLSISERLVLNRLKFHEFPRLPQQGLAEIAREGNSDPLDAYLRFVNAIDLSSPKKPVVSFDLDAFFNVFNAGFADEITSAFIDLFLADSSDHPKKDRVMMLYILVFIYIYAGRNGMDTRLCRKKIEEHAFLFRPLYRFSLRWQGDPFIDKFVMHLRQNSYDLNEAIFLNQIYLVRTIDKPTFDVFHRRLMDVLATIPELHIFSFLQHVFTYSTVMFSCINETHLYKLIISHYKNANKNEQLSSLLEILTNKVDDPDLNEVFVSQFRELGLTTLKYKRQCFVVEIRQFRSMSEYKDFFLRNRESFNGLMCGFGELTRLYGTVHGLKKELVVLDVLFYLFDSMKPEFLPPFVKHLCNFLIEVLCGITCFDGEFLEFNEMHWKTLSNIVLVTQRLGVGDLEERKKKKDGSIKLSEISRLALRLFSTISEVEEKAVRSGQRSIVTLKKRGFQIS